MGKRFQIQRFFRYYFKAANKYQIHSPFVFNFINEILENKENYYAFEELELLRKRLKKDHTLISVTDFGAGSQVANKKERKVSSIAQSAVSSPFFGQLLFKLIHHYKPQNIIEMGTSLGLTTLYQAKARQKARMITLEGCPNIAAKAQQHFKDFACSNAELKVGEFGKTLDKALEELPSVDYVYFDGNHRKEPTLTYFEKCCQKAHPDSIFVFDDIHWSEGMEEAWETIVADDRVRLSIDLFFMGIVFFRKEQQEKEHHILIPTKWKPIKW